MKKIIVPSIVIALLTLVFPSQAQNYPNKPVKLIIPQAAGGATDVFARYIGQKLSLIWNQPVVTENKVGAAGVIGTDLVAKSSPDGYTLLLTYAGSQAVNPSLYPKIPFDSVKDFQTVATVATTPFFLVVGVNSPIQNFQQLITQGRNKTSKLSYATSGNGSINHLLSESLKVEAGIEMVHVPYKAISAAMTDVISGNVDNAFGAVPSVIQLIRGGKLKAIAVSSSKRNSSLPEVPSIAELGFPNFDVSPWWGILAPAGTPKSVVEKINADVNGILKTPEAQAFFKDQGADTLITTPEVFSRMLESDVQKWAKVVKSSGAKID